MNVIALTVFVGLLLAGCFVLLWLVSACDPRSFNERDALMPLESDLPHKPSSSPNTQS